jgi:hypothetical protein
MEKNGFFESGFIANTITSQDLMLLNSTILSENKKFADQYEELMKQEGKQLDSKIQYRRAMLQTINIGLASAILLGFIYKQLS